MTDETDDERDARLGYRPLTLSERQRRVMESRGTVLIQPKPAGTPTIPLNVRGREGIPFDVMLTLESLRLLADQGNLTAKHLYETERRKLGIDQPTHH